MLTIIEYLPVTYAGITESLFSRLPIRDCFVLSSLTGSSGKISGRSKSGQNKSTVDQIKNMLTDYGSLT